MRREAPGHMKQGDQKGALEVLLLSFIVRSFYRQRVLVTLQRILAISILCRAVVTTREASSRLRVLLSFMLISLHDLFCATGDGFTLIHL
jgi:hypothetical protein